MDTSANHINQTIEHLFRHQSGKMLSVLTRIFGTHNLEMAEDIVQDTLLKAFEIWKYKGLPDNPEAWLMKVAKNKAIDTIRKEKVRTEFAKDISVLLKSEYTLQPTIERLIDKDLIEDDLLRMMFACCHPKLAEESQIALILKTLCGFSIGEIAKAFLSNEETIGKRLYRSKQFLKEQGTQFEIPQPTELAERLNQVMTVIYLIFNEGYQSASHHNVIRIDMIEEAMRLAWMLANNPHTGQPDVFALIALMCFHAARFESRLDSEGHLLLLAEQDRTLWDRELIAKGMEFFNKAIENNHFSTYHLEAAIAKEHCLATSYEKTNWQIILDLYDLLFKLKPSPLVALNRIIIIAEINGASKALLEISQLKDKEILENYYLYYAVLGDLHSKTKDSAQAIKHYQKAITLTNSKEEIYLLQDKITKNA